MPLVLGIQRTTPPLAAGGRAGLPRLRKQGVGISQQGALSQPAQGRVVETRPCPATRAQQRDETRIVTSSRAVRKLPEIPRPRVRFPAARHVLGATP